MGAGVLGIGIGADRRKSFRTENDSSPDTEWIVIREPFNRAALEGGTSRIALTYHATLDLDTQAISVPSPPATAPDFEGIAARINLLVETNNAQNGRWGQAFIDFQAPVYNLNPAGDHSYLGLFGELKVLGRYGNWTGGGYGGGHLSPAFDFSKFDLTKADQRLLYESELAKFAQGGEFWENPSVGYLDEFDRLARSHDLLYQDANLTAAQAYRQAGRDFADGLISAAQLAHVLATEEDKQELAFREADVWFMEYSRDIRPSDPYGIALKTLSNAVFGLLTDAFYIQHIDSFPTREVLQKIGEVYGSRLGQLIAGDNIFAERAGEELGVLIGNEIADFFEGNEGTGIGDSLLAIANGELPISKLFNDALEEAGGVLEDLAREELTKLANALMADAAKALGLSGVGEYLFIQTGQAIGDYLVDLLSSGDIDGVGDFFDTISADLDFSSIGNFLIDAAIEFLGDQVNDFIGSILDGARDLVEIDSSAEGYLAELGSLIGSVIGSIELPFLGGEIGSAIGHILGSIVFEVLDFVSLGLLGDIIDFFTGGDPHPESWVYVGLDPATGHIEIIGQDWKKDGIDVPDILRIHDGNLQLNAAFRTYVNEVIDSIGGTVDDAFFSTITPRLGVIDPNVEYLAHAMIGFRTDNFFVRTYYGGTEARAVTSTDPQAIIAHAVAFELAHLIFYGGDLAQVRALNRWEAALNAQLPENLQGHYAQHQNLKTAPNDPMLGLLGANLQIAEQYRYYLDNQEAINLLMMQAPTSAFTLGWITTLARAAELGLNDPYSGWPDGAATLPGGGTVLTADGDDLVHGNVGEDVVKTYGGDDRVYGDAGADQIFGGGGRDTLVGDSGNDTLDGGEGDDKLYGGEGEDLLQGRRGADLLLGDAGADRLYGGEGRDFLFGYTGDDFLYGEAGDDEMAGEAGNDRLEGGAGNDVLYGDVPGAAGNDVLIGGDGNDLARGGLGTDMIEGGAGIDRLYGDEGDDTIAGGDGEDRLYGGAGADVLDGGAGNDRILGDDGNDTLAGGDGDDLLYGLGGNDLAEGGVGIDSLFGDMGDDLLRGGDGDDRLGGWRGTDSLDGGAGNDLLAGEDGNDQLAGGAGNDVLYGDRQPDSHQPAHSEAEIIASTLARIGAGDFAILYQGPSYTYAGLLAADHDMIIINPAETLVTGTPNSEEPWSRASIDAIEASGKLLIGYLNVAKINDFVDYWDTDWTVDGQAGSTLADDAPCFLSEDDTGFSHTRLVDFWKTEWRDLLIERVNQIVDQGFSGMFLDDVLEYFTRRGDSLAEIAQAAREMRDLVIDLAAAGRARADLRDGAGAGEDFVIIVNGAPFLINDSSRDGSAPDPQLATDFYASIDAFLAENYFSGQLGYAVDQAIAEYGSRGIALLSVDTDIVTDQRRIEIEKAAIDAGFLPEVVPEIEYVADTPRFVPGYGDLPAPGDDVLDGGAGDDLLFGGAGSDTASYASSLTAVVVDLRIAGPQATGAGTDTLTDIENLTGGGFNDQLTGNAFANVLIGGGGNDILAGGAGNDIYRVEQAGDIVLESIGGGSDSVYAVTSYTLAAGAEIELLSAIDPGSTAAMNLTGNEYANRLYGNAGVNILIGGGGADTLTGGAGNDIYRVEEAGDIVLESIGGGSDSVYAVTSYTLAAGAEIELLSAIDPGSTGAMNLTGNEYANRLYGNAGVNILIGGGGADTLTGGAGNDIYRVEEAGDIVLESIGGGSDSVYAVTSYALAAGAEIEMLSAIDPGSTGAMNLTGNEYANMIIGTAGANTLIGGAGNDTLIGGAGNDVYRVEDAGDVVVEGAGGGADSIYAVTSYVLSAGSQVELLSAIDPGSTGAMNLTGNEYANMIIGTAGANTLIGGAGNDTLIGGAGNDVYRVEDAGDVVLEYAGGGSDSVYAVTSYALAAGSQVELLSAIDPASAGAMNLTGNEFAQTLYGTAGANLLNGLGGADILWGFAGADSFAFTAALGGGNVDTIVDFVSAVDKIALDDALFGGIGSPGAFSAAAFFAGTAAHDADDRIIYDGATGQIFYDADGNGGGAAIHFATLHGAPTLTASDFQVI